MLPDVETCYRAVASRDPRFDGRFFTGVLTTGIYCRPVCPAHVPRAENVRFYGSAAAAAAAGFRACRRCRPESIPGSRQWDARADLAGRALQLIASGVTDNGGVGAVADRLHVSERHLHRVLTAEVGAGPLALARTRRAQTARLLLDETDLPMSDVAFASGFASVRQFNDTIRAEFGAAPTALRAARRPADLRADPGSLVLRLRHRPPYDVASVVDFFRDRAVDGLEDVDGQTLTRYVRAPHGPARIEATPGPSFVRVRIAPRSLEDLPVAVAAVRRMFDLDADPAAVTAALSNDPLLGASVRARPGMRVPACSDGFELVVRAVLGQRVSVASARASAGRLVSEHGEQVVDGVGGPVTHVFPTPSVLAEAVLPNLPVRLATTVRTVARAVADGSLDLDVGTDREATTARLLAIAGIGPWTTQYVAMRAWGDPDAFPDTDLILRRVMARTGVDADAWRPWRAYAAMHMWASPELGTAPDKTHPEESKELAS